MNVKKIEPYVVICGLSWIIYVLAYFGRLNLSIVIPWLEDEYAYSKATLGFLAAGFFAAYAGGQLINGVLGDRFNPRYFISIGLLASGVSNLCFAFFPFLKAMFVSWVINGYFQSMLWGPMLRTISEHVPARKHKSAVFLMATSPAAGYFLSYTGIGKIAVLTGWKAAFIVPGLLLAGASALWFFYLGRRKAGETPAGSRSSGKGGLARFIITKKLYYVIVLGVMVGLVKEGLTFWGPSLLAAQGAAGIEKALYLMSLIPVVTFLFVVVNGLIINNTRIKLRRIITLFALFAFVSSLAMQLWGNYTFLTLLLSFYAVMTASYCANNLMTSYLPLEYRGEGRISTAAGIIDSSFYLGAAVAGPGAGALADHFGWPGIYTGFTAACLAALIAAILLQRSER